MAVSNPGINDNFFELGGHSLLATRVIARINHAFDTTLPLRALFETPTIGGLALALTESKIRMLPEITRITLLERLETLSDAAAEQLLTEKSTEKNT
jgi:acyl carrier protein